MSLDSGMVFCCCFEVKFMFPCFRFGFPALIYLRKGKSKDDPTVAFVHRGKFEEIALSSFLSSGKNLNAGIKMSGWPTIGTVDPWDFQDPPQLATDDDDFDLDAFLAED